MTDTKALVEYLIGLAPKLQGNGELIGMQDAYDAAQAVRQAAATIERLEAEVEAKMTAIRYAQGHDVDGSRPFSELCGHDGGPKYAWRNEMLRLASMT